MPTPPAFLRPLLSPAKLVALSFPTAKIPATSRAPSRTPWARRCTHGRSRAKSGEGVAKQVPPAAPVPVLVKLEVPSTVH